MAGFTRYAIYYTPEPGPLAEFGARWLGWDAARGVEMPHPDIPRLPRPVSEITATPRKYGFHATIKPPFRLSPDTTPDALAADLAAFCDAHPPVSLDGLALTRLGSFLALTPTGDAAKLSRLAAHAVIELDRHRAEPSGPELARRRSPQLTPSQKKNLDRWGYPYVMEDFRFHLTLTGRLSRADITATEAALAGELTRLSPSPFTLRSLCLFGEAGDGHFHQLSRHRLAGRN